MDEKMKMVLCEIKYAAQEIISLHKSIENATEEMENLATREKYVSVRQTAIKIWQEKLKEQEHNLNQAIEQYKQLA